jgi:hypothetical protein
MNTNEQKIETLFGGRLIIVTHEDGGSEEVKVSQLRLADYDRAFLLIEDELGLTAVMCGKDKAWINTLQPESYDELQAVAREVNARGFFSFAERRQARLFNAMANFKPEALMEMMDRAKSTSPTLSSNLQRR